jgi:beta-lactamase regulating signal transducer with metallopeptidase domain
MSLGALIGFGLAFVLVSWTTSAALGGALAIAARRRRDPAVERVLCAAAIVAPPLVALATVGAILADSVARGAAADHCLPHAHHLHLCLAHAGGWAASPAAVVVATMVAVVVLARLVGLIAIQLRASLAVTALSRSARREDGALVVPSQRAFLFVAGMLRPRIVASEAAFRVLDGEARTAALAHERAHVRGRDLMMRAVLSLAALAGAPVLARRVLASWDRATERLRDHDAAAEVGHDAVAGALVAMARSGATPPAWATAAMAPAGELVARVEALLDGATPDRSLSRRLLAAAAAAVAVAALAAAVGADPLHHALETVLGVF